MQTRPEALKDWLAAYAELGASARRTTHVLAGFIEGRMPLSTAQERALSDTLEHLAAVREGFQLKVRAAELTSSAEMQLLLDRAEMDWGWLEQLGWRLVAATEIELPHDQLVAFSHAALSLAMLPRLPKARVTFPRTRQSYADIPVPSTQAELLQRLEELERVIYRVLGGARARVEGESLRRTYGYFESSAWLVADHRKKFLDA